jgi:hypothetical protein
MYGTDLLRNAQRHGKPQNALSLDATLEAWFATREPWGGLTIDLVAVQAVSPRAGYAVSTGGDVRTGYHKSVSPAAGFPEFVQALFEVASRTPQGQYLGVGLLHDADLNRIDIDTVYLTDDREKAIAVGVAAHSTGGIYDFATGRAIWVPHLKEG